MPDTSEEGGPRLSSPVAWILQNKYLHMATLLAPTLTSKAVGRPLVERLERRLLAARRLNGIRRVFFALVYTSAVAPAILAILNTLAADPYLTRVTAILLGVAVVLGATVGVIAVAILTRTLGIVEAELYLLAIEAGIQRSAGRAPARAAPATASAATSDVVGPTRRGRKAKPTEKRAKNHSPRRSTKG